MAVSSATELANFLGQKCENRGGRQSPRATQSPQYTQWTWASNPGPAVDSTQLHSCWEEINSSQFPQTLETYWRERRLAYFRGPESTGGGVIALRVGHRNARQGDECGSGRDGSGLSCSHLSHPFRPVTLMFFSSPIQICSWEKIPRPGNSQLVCNSGVVQQVSTHQTCSVLGIYWGKDSEDFSWIYKYFQNLVLISKNPAIHNVTNKKCFKFSDVDSSVKLPLSGQHSLLFMVIAFCKCLFLSPYHILCS